MSLKTWWKKKDKYVKRGIVIGALFGLGVFLTLDRGFLGSIFYYFGMLPVCTIFVFDPGCPTSTLFLGWILFPLLYASLGALIGFIIGKVKGK